MEHDGQLKHEGRHTRTDTGRVSLPTAAGPATMSASATPILPQIPATPSTASPTTPFGTDKPADDEDNETQKAVGLIKQATALLDQIKSIEMLAGFDHETAAALEQVNALKTPHSNLVEVTQTIFHILQASDVAS